MATIGLQNGIILDDDVGYFAQGIPEYAKSKGVDNCRLFIATENGLKFYVLFIGENAVCESPKIEHILGYIDTLYLVDHFLE